MKNTTLYILLLFLVPFFVGCDKNDKTTKSNSIPNDSLISISPKTTKAELSSEVITAKAPIVNKAKTAIPSERNSNVQSLSSGKKTLALNPIISELKKPKIFPAKFEKVAAALPQVVQALPFRTREVNPQNIKFIDIEQGLKNSIIYALIEDINGGIWIGTKMGITKYDGKFLSSYTENEGLISNNVSTMFQDSKGNIWIGTRGNGLSKFDGKYFYNYQSDSALINNSILSIYESKDGTIWLGSDLGAISLENNQFNVYSKSQGIESNISSIVEDKNGDLCMSTYEKGIYIIKDNKIFNYNESHGLCDNAILTIKKDNSGNLWFGGNSKGLSIFDGKEFTNYSTEHGLSSNSIMCLAFNKNSTAWLGTFGNGLNKIKNNTITYFDETQGLNHLLIRSLAIGNAGELWIGTEGAGVAKYEGDMFTHYTTKEGLSNSLIWSTTERNKNEFIYASGGGGLIIKSENKFQYYTSQQGISFDNLTCVTKSKNGDLYFGSYEVGFNIFDGTNFSIYTKEQGLVNNTIWSLCKDKKDNLWIGTNTGFSKFDGNSFTNYTAVNKIPLSSIFSIYEDKKGNIWLATNGNGVIKYDGTNFFNYTIEHGLVNNVISCVYEDSKGNIWFGSQNGGISRFNGEKFTNLNESNGLSNNAILSLIEDNDKNMWFGTRGGLNKLNEKLVNLPSEELIASKKLFITYGVTEGFTGNNCARNSVYKDNTGKIWWGTAKMLTLYNPEADRKDTIAPKMQITGLKLFFDDVNWSSFKSENDDSTATKHAGITFDSVSYWNSMPINLNLPYHQNHVTINYIGINFKSQDKILYEYIMDGFEDNWNPVTTKTEAVYSNLPAGNFTFKVKAMNKDGVWSEPISYQFSISPPWWKTWWFRTLAIIIIVAAVWFYIKQRERVLRQRQMELEQTVEERTHEVVEQKEIIEEKQKEILDSINYAKRIQRALLASTKLLNENLKSENNDASKAEDHFVYFQPKDIVSGDFYWASNLADGRFVIVTADSTGHGVPGAIMSMLNISCLNEAVNGKELTNAADILNHTRTKVISNLANDGSAEGGKDGMDCSVICYDFKNLKMNYAAANNPIWIVRKIANENGELVKTMIELKPDKMPCGKHDRDNIPFNSYEFDLQKGDLVYALTDGFPDQFGGEKGKKYMYKKLKEFLVENAHHPMAKQYKFLNAEFNYWKQDTEQVDDVLIIGIKV
ncbi:MAG: SpoIIE family protein phosphatase [Bacteroidetes bacterium]|nr:SpoIIE family protein phosphatase [Bacteroidota bacterium]